MQQALAALLALTVLPALADRPLVSETADVIGHENCQVEAGLARASVSGQPSARSSDVFFSCGLPAHNQVGLGYSRSQDAGRHDEALRVLAKTTLLMPEAGRTGWGLAYGFDTAKTADSRWRVDHLGVLAVATRELTSGLLAHANLGWNHSRAAGQNSTLWSLGVETTSDLTVAADVFGDDRNKPAVSAGMGYSFGGGFSANISYVLVLENPRTRLLTLGAKFAF